MGAVTEAIIETIGAAVWLEIYDPTCRI